MVKAKKIIGLLLAVLLIFTLAAACGQQAGSKSTESKEPSESEKTVEESKEPIEAKGGKVGILSPTVNVVRFVTDSEYMQAKLQDMGYTAEIQYADDNVSNQINQIENMITKGFDVLILIPVDAEAVAPACDKAFEAGIGIISYDRLVKATKSVTYYATFDNVKVGEACGQYIVDKLDLENVEGPFNIELFTGDIADNNAKMTLDGAMSVLQPYIDNGKLVVPSGQTALEQCVTQGWDSGAAQDRMENIISGFYSDKKLDAVMTTYGGMGIGVATALKENGYGTADKPMPIITGQDAELRIIKSIIADEMTMSICKDTRVLGDIAVGMADAIIKGEDYPINDTSSYDNGAFIVPTYLADVTVFDKDNLDEVTIDSGLFTREEVYGK
ncbi:MAG: substrate-binding domain-containing protein [Christensenellales bacterium]